MTDVKAQTVSRGGQRDYVFADANGGARSRPGTSECMAESRRRAIGSIATSSPAR